MYLCIYIYIYIYIYNPFICIYVYIYISISLQGVQTPLAILGRTKTMPQKGVVVVRLPL